MSTSPVNAEVKITAPYGLHARPAAHIVDVLRQRNARLRIDGKSANSLQEIMALGIRGDSVLRLEVEGEGAEGTMALLQEILAEPLV